MTQKKAPRDRLRNPQICVYLAMDLQDWLKAKAVAKTKETGFRVTVSEVLREILKKVKDSENNS